MNRPWVFRGRGILFSPFLAMTVAVIAAAGPLSFYYIEKPIGAETFIIQIPQILSGKAAPNENPERR